LIRCKLSNTHVQSTPTLRHLFESIIAANRVNLHKGTQCDIRSWLSSNSHDCLERSPSSISRELGRNTPSDFDGLYSSRAADNLAKERKATASQSKAFKGIESFVDSYLRQSLANHTFPNVVSGELALKYQTKISENTLYRYIQRREELGEPFVKIYLEEVSLTNAQGRFARRLRIELISVCVPLSLMKK
jgi:IS30 family transposase